MDDCNRRPSARGAAYAAALLLILAVAGGSIPVASSRSPGPASGIPQGYADSVSRSLSQETSGGRLVFKRVDINSPTQAGNGIYIMDADGANLRRLDTGGVEPALSR